MHKSQEKIETTITIQPEKNNIKREQLLNGKTKEKYKVSLSIAMFDIIIHHIDYKR